MRTQHEEIVAKRPRVLSEGTFNSVISEILGTFIFVLFFLVSTDKKTQYSQEKAMNCLVISSSYTGAMMIAGGGMVTLGQPLLNPFIALGLALWSGVWDYPQYMIFPWLGSVLALIFYELIFVRTLEYLEADDDEDENEDRQLELDLDADDQPQQKEKLQRAQPT